jgi:hypothetical protein
MKHQMPLQEMGKLGFNFLHAQFAKTINALQGTGHIVIYLAQDREAFLIHRTYAISKSIIALELSV